MLGRRDGVRADLERFIAASDADLAPLLHEALQDAIADYELLKSKSGCLDFLDLLIKVRDLVRDNRGVRLDLQRRFSHFFVDEFQVIPDPLQAEVLLLLAADHPDVADWRAVRPVPGKLFIVGDPKQSIYRFRRADVTQYEDVKRHLLVVGAEVLHLTTSFRAPPSIQRFVNSAFALAIAADPETSGYVALQPSRPEVKGRPTIIALPVPKPYGDYGKIIGSRINRSYTVRCRRLHRAGWTTGERLDVIEEQRRLVLDPARAHRHALPPLAEVSRVDLTRPIRSCHSKRGAYSTL